MPSVADFLIERLKNAGVNHVFGVPGDYVINFYKKLSDCKDIEVINTTDESHAGFAADGYARVNGVGCVCVTYNVGALKIANAVACAYAERSPMIVISGSPGLKERKEGVLLHHMVRSFECQKQVFENITCYSVVLDDPSTAGYKIDNALEHLKHHKQPIYIELPRDIADKSISYDVYKQGTPDAPKSDEYNLNEAINEVSSWLAISKNPVILVGVQSARYGIANDIVKFAEKCNIPIATTLLSKSAVNEKHPLFLGVYAGATSKPHVREAIENSDCLLMFGVLVTDMTLNFMPARFTKRQTVYSSVESLQVSGHTYTNITFQDFVKTLVKQQIAKKDININIKSDEVGMYIPTIGKKITISRFFEKINSIITDNMAIVADIGDSLFGAFDLIMHRDNYFLSPAFYTSMGFAIPAALGLQAANPKAKTLVIVGDGAFQMSCTEISTILQRKTDTIIFVINNGGYATERMLLDGPFNDISNWNYSKIIEMLGGGKAFIVKTEDELDVSLEYGLKTNSGLTIIELMIDKLDMSPALKRMTEGLALRLK